MKTYLLTVIVTSIVLSLSELILPHGKLKNVVSTVFSIVLLISMISPINLSDYDIIIPTFNESENEQFEEDVDVFNYFDTKAEICYEKEYALALKAENLITEKIIVEISNMKIQKVEIYLSNLVIPENNQHINNIVIQNYVAEILGLDSQTVEVYG